MKHNYYSVGTPEYDELKEKLRKEDNIRYAHDPIFAPITYGDDRQVGRTRRGIHCQIENNYNPELVYCKCLGCNYQWIMDKSKYIAGTGDIGNRPNPNLTKNIGQGGTGLVIGNFPHPDKNNKLKYEDLPHDITKYYDYDKTTGKYIGDTYSKYNVLAHDTSACKETVIKCEDGYLHSHDFYPLTGGTGYDGNIRPEVLPDLGYDPSDGHLTGETGSIGLGGAIPIYTPCSSDLTFVNHPGGSGTYGGGTVTDPVTGNIIDVPAPRTFGGHPMACPNCCRVNFIAKWLELHDRPEYPQHIPGALSNLGFVQNPTTEEFEGNPDMDSRYYTKFLPWLKKSAQFFKTLYVREKSDTWEFKDSVFIKPEKAKYDISIIVFESNGKVLAKEDIKVQKKDFKLGEVELNFKKEMTGSVLVLQSPPKKPTPIPKFKDIYNETLPWIYYNKFLAKFEFFPASSHWFVEDDVFRSHVSLLVFNHDGRIIKEENIYKIQINHIAGNCRIIWNGYTMAGYIWVLIPATILKGFIPNIENVCEAIIVRDFQRIKSHFTEVF